MPFQSANAGLFDDFMKSIQENFEALIRQALEISEEHAVQIAMGIGYDFSKIYFENFVDLSSSDLMFERVLLYVVFNYDINHYYEILNQSPILRQFELEKQSQFIEEKKAEIKEKFPVLGEYDTEAWKIVKYSVKRQIVASYSDESNLAELDKRRGIIDEATIAVLQLMPTYDPEEGRVVTLNYTAVKLVQEIPSLKGSDIEKDPIRASALVVLDPEYLLYMNIIETNDGWISIEEAETYNYKSDEIRRAKLALLALDFAMDAKKIEDPNKKLQDFNVIIKEINSEIDILIAN